MKANNIIKTLFTCSVQEYNLAEAHSSKSAVQRVNIVKKILDLIMRERRVREGARQAKWLQCDQIWRVIGLWANFKAFGDN